MTDHITNSPNASTCFAPTSTREPLLPPVLVVGFAAGLALWTAWFIAHLPVLNLPEQVSIPALLLLWLVVLTLGTRLAPRAQALRVGPLSGLLSALLGLLVLGSRLTTKTVEDHTNLDAASLVPNAGLIALGFLTLGTVLGLIGGTLARAFPRRAESAPAPGASRAARPWLPRFALLAVLVTAPLLFIGGLVTSTNSGMAVPDWPNTYGTNMFLYPLGPRMQASASDLQPDEWRRLLSPADARTAETLTGEEQATFIASRVQGKIYVEHFHRLFGTLTGLATLILMVWTLRSGASKYVKGVAIAAFAFVCTQGILGGIRVLQGAVESAEDNRLYAMLHGVLGQLTFGVIAALAVYLWPAFRETARGVLAGDASGKRVRLLATAALHSTILQLILGAAFRHFRHSHILWTHVAFAFFVTILGVLAGFAAMSMAQRLRSGEAREGSAPGPVPSLIPGLGTLGVALAACVGVQFALGWVAFLAGNWRSVESANAFQAIARTLHQANGAALLALLVAVFLCARQLAPKRMPAAPAASRTGAAAQVA